MWITEAKMETTTTAKGVELRGFKGFRDLGFRVLGLPFWTPGSTVVCRENAVQGHAKFPLSKPKTPWNPSPRPRVCAAAIARYLVQALGRVAHAGVLGLGFKVRGKKTL